MARSSKTPNLRDIQQHVVPRVADKWKDLAVFFAFDKDGSQISIIHSDHSREGVRRCCTEAFILWLKSKGEDPPSWERLIGYLEAIELGVLAKDLREMFCDIPEEVDGNAPTSHSKPTSVVKSATPPDEGQAIACEKYAFIPEVKNKFRKYQQELATPGLSGQNYIICAPTGCGKTMVAGCIIANHLQQQRRRMILFMVDKVHLATQQKKALENYIYDAKFIDITGQDSVSQKMVELSLENADVIVSTAGYIECKMKDESVLKITDFSLIVIDECHHALKQHPHARIMQHYLAVKMKRSTDDLPQVVGLTASPGAGGGMNVMEVCENLLNLCAQIDAVGGIHVVEKNKEELDKYTNQPLHEVVSCKGRSENEEFLTLATQAMSHMEQKFFGNRSFPHVKWTQKYMSEVKNITGAFHYDQKNVLTVLLFIAKGISIYMDLEKDDAIAYLEEQVEHLPKGERMTSAQHTLHAMYIELLRQLQALNPVSNPLLLRLKSIILEGVQQYPESKIIVIVETIRQARSIRRWIANNKDLKDKIVSRVVVGQRKEEGMTKAEQITNISSLRDEDTNLLVATSILEEGMDIPKCKLVIRYQHVSNEVARVQVEGRARDVDSKVFTILSSEQKKNQEDANRERVQLVSDAISHLPSGQLLKKGLHKRQVVLIEKQEQTRKEEATRKRQHSEFDVELMCRQCGKFLCYGSDLRSYWQHKVVLDPAFETRVDSRKKNESKHQGDLTRTHDLICKKCGYDLGVKGNAEGKEFFVVKCRALAFKINGQETNFKTWNKVPFPIANYK